MVVKTSMNNANPNIRILEIFSQTDVAYAALEARKYAKEIGFQNASQCMIATAVSELARNIIIYAKEGRIQLERFSDKSKTGIEVVAEDTGPGIEDVEQAMQERFSTGGTLGVGLPGTRRLMDFFEIDTQPGVGTKITIRKWI